MLTIGVFSALVFAIFDVFVWQANIETIYAGEQFTYGSHVSVFSRLPLALSRIESLNKQTTE